MSVILHGTTVCDGAFEFSWYWKTTVLSRILNSRQGKKVAVIVNDMSDINIDAAMVQNEVSLSHKEEMHWATFQVAVALIKDITHLVNVFCCLFDFTRRFLLTFDFIND